jgi:hypothetical protein
MRSASFKSFASSSDSLHSWPRAEGAPLSSEAAAPEPLPALCTWST